MLESMQRGESMAKPKADGAVMVQLAVRLPAGLVRLLDEAATKDAELGFAPSRGRTLTRVLPDALEALIAKRKAGR